MAQNRRRHDQRKKRVLHAAETARQINGQPSLEQIAQQAKQAQSDAAVFDGIGRARFLSSLSFRISIPLKCRGRIRANMTLPRKKPMMAKAR